MPCLVLDTLQGIFLLRFTLHLKTKVPELNFYLILNIGVISLITGYFGLPGCGKSTFLSKFAQHYIKLGYRVFVHEDSPVDGCYLFRWEDLGRYDMSCSVILIDEISLKADNRDFAKFSDVVKQFFILHRHYHCDIIWFTQQYDGVDRKIRELTTCLYYIRSAGMFSYAIRIDRFIHVDKERKQIMVGFKLSNFFRILFGWLNGSLKLCFRPRYYRYFDSYEAPSLPIKYFKQYIKNPPVVDEEEPEVLPEDITE